MLYREIISVCSQIHTKHFNTLCGQNVELLDVELAVHIVTIGLWKIKDSFITETLWGRKWMYMCTMYVSHGYLEEWNAEYQVAHAMSQHSWWPEEKGVSLPSGADIWSPSWYITAFSRRSQGYSIHIRVTYISVSVNGWAGGTNRLIQRHHTKLD
jgi:hypothetical protein